MEVREFLNNIEVESLNRTDFRITIDYLNNIVVEETDINDVQFGFAQQGDNSDPVNIIKNWSNPLEPIPYRREIVYNGTTYVIFDGFFNSFEAEYSDESVVGRVYQQNGLENLQRLMESTTFEYLYAIKVITDDDFVMLPYVVKKQPITLDSYLVGFSTFVMAMQLAQQINELQKLFAEGANPFTTASASIKFGIVVLFITTLLAAIVDNLVRLFRLIIQPVKYHATMRVFRQLERGFAWLGFNFNSSILEGIYKDLAILPTKQTSLEDDDGLLGLLSPNKINEKGFFKGSLQDLVNEINIIFNGRLFIIGNNVRLERRDYKPSAPEYTLSGVEYDEFKYNSEEFVKDFQFSFLTDLNDKNTIQKYDGTATQVLTVPNGVNNGDLWRGQKLQSVRSSFALAKRKTEIYPTELIYKGFIQTVNTVYLAPITFLIRGFATLVNGFIGVYNTIIDVLNFFGLNLPKATPISLQDIDVRIDDPITTRLNMLEMSSDDVQVPKFFILNENKIDPTLTRISLLNELLINADNIYNTFYRIDSFVHSVSKPLGNQYKRFRIESDVFDVRDYFKVRNNAYIYNENGQECELEKIVWDVDAETCEIDFRQNELFVPDLQEFKVPLNGK